MDEKIVVNGREYIAKTYNRCQVCGGQSDDDRFMMLKAKLASSNIVLECPRCDFEQTVDASTVKVMK